MYHSTEVRWLLYLKTPIVTPQKYINSRWKRIFPLMPLSVTKTEILIINKDTL